MEGALQKRVAVRRPAATSIWLGLAALVVIDAAFGLGGADTVLKDGLSDSLLWAATGVCLAGALRATHSRGAWLLAAAGLASWSLGDTIWSVRFAGDAQAPVTSVSDIFWLAWYPLIFAALVLLVRDRVPRFELHRWIDGVVVMLVVVTPWIALFLQPVADHSSASALADAVDFAYPLGDAILVGAVLGAFALMGWCPGRMWLVLGAGLAAIGLADAVYSIQALEQSYRGGVYDAVWVGGATLIAYAAWCRHPGQLDPREVTGWTAIALPLVAQTFAVSIQIYGLFVDIPTIERALAVVVMVMVVVQIVLTRPRRAAREPVATAGGQRE
jgi:hypothetical protein